MISLKKIVKASRLYPIAREWHHTHALRGWGRDDAARLHFYSRFIRPNDLVFDVGANVGNRTKVFLRLGARVVAFEPQSSCVRVLKRALAKNPSFRLVQAALGESRGSAELRVGSASVLATLSEKWISAARESGRFEGESWEAREKVEVTTFDQAIQEFGRPVFSKVDVEGFEQQVFAGLSQPVPSGSLEFAAEFLEGTLWCLDRLASFQDCGFQYSAAETMRFDWPGWLDIAAARKELASIARKDPFSWGDVYFAEKRLCGS